jgi:hypothetical protein
MSANEKDNISTCLTLYAGEEWQMGKDRNHQLSTTLKLEKQLSVIQDFLDVNTLSTGK